MKTTDSSSRSAVITGLGAVSPIGIGVDSYRNSLQAGVSGVRPIEPDDRIRSGVAAPCSDFEPSDIVSSADLRRLPRLAPMALAAATEALTQARRPFGPELDVQGGRSVGLVLGTGGGGIDFTLDQARSIYAGGKASLWTITNATHGNLAGELSIRLGLRGPSLCVSTGCASSSDAVGLAMDLLRSDRPGTPEAVVVVGADAHIRWETLAAMELLGVVSTKEWSDEEAPTACRPFDKSRSGFVLGEGAWAAVLERPDVAADRGARPVGRVLGYGCTCDAHHRVRPAEDMAESARAMTLAMRDARVEPEGIGVVHYHGTGTPLNDRLETMAVRLAFGDHADRLTGSSCKSMIGHPQGASGMAALVATVAALSGDDPFVPPTINLHEPGEGCDLDYTPLEARPAPGRVALVNCLAFGAKNSALVVEGCA
ncbi:MAG: beta-ketoacyl-[acyl-carrier-protein] synthase family protein [Phycisphaerales bacterium]|nr:MAG: beta-ketoacyl-[acyl-carrier-protein] synthase family protein [Phycisphaerales bacterium]